MAVYAYADKEGKQQEYLLAFAKQIWALGTDFETDEGIKKVLKEVELEWSVAQSYLQDNVWREWTEKNRQDLYGLGLWGVPSFSYGEFSAWGQDRLWALERAILK